MEQYVKSAINVNYDKEELTQHGTSEFPLRTFTNITLAEETGIIPWHWHREFELISCTFGHMDVYTDSGFYTLNPGEAVFINSGILHQVTPHPSEKPVHYSYCFAPEFLSGAKDSLIEKKYVIPFINRADLSSYRFCGTSEWELKCLEMIDELNKEALKEDYGYELLLRNRIEGIFLLLTRNLPYDSQPDHRTDFIKNGVIKDMLTFLHNHYTDRVSLDDLAAVSSLSKSSCNRLFHKVIGCTPFDYLTDYRLKRSIHLLLESDKSVTEIAYMCGFSDVSYYCKIFRQKKGISPAKFRVRHGS